jgi:hypothetical protein
MLLFLPPLLHQDFERRLARGWPRPDRREEGQHEQNGG